MKKRKQVKGQAATEYILTAAVIGLMILPAAYLFYRYSQSSADQIDKAQMDRLGRDVVSTAEKVYYQGAPSRSVIETRMPSGVQNLSIIGDWGSGTQMLIIKATAQGVVAEFPYPSRVNINGSFNGSLNAITNSPGIKRISIEAYEAPAGPGGQTTSFAFLNFGGRCPISNTYDFNTDGVVDATDQNFVNQCNLNAGARPKFRPEKIWQDGWFNNAGALGGNVFAVCMNADYNGDCAVDDTDAAQFCAVSGLLPCP